MLELVRDHWESISWLPAPLRLSLFVAIVLLLVLVAIPWIMRVAGRCLSGAATPLLGALLYPEFVVTSVLRRSGRPAPSIAFGYDRIAIGLVSRLSALGAFVSRAHLIRAKGIWVLLLLLSVVSSSLWYIVPRPVVAEKLSPLQSVVGAIERTDSWFHSSDPEASDHSDVKFDVRVSRSTAGVLVEGWIFDYSSPSEDIGLMVESGDTEVYVAVDVDRPDVNAAYDISGRHGFSTQIQAPAGQQLCVGIAPTDWFAGLTLQCGPIPTNS